jgi:hypothetical protein
VQLTAEHEQVVIRVGLSGDRKSEGTDHPHMDPPPRTDGVVKAVLDI